MARARSRDVGSTPVKSPALSGLLYFPTHERRDTEWGQSSNNSPTAALYNISGNTIQSGNTEEKAKGKDVINYGDDSSLHITKS